MIKIVLDEVMCKWIHERTVVPYHIHLLKEGTPIELRGDRWRFAGNLSAFTFLESYGFTNWLKANYPEVFL